jgi:radical SAM superfamily enzyme YgiQ (UPF0313 family)
MPAVSPATADRFFVEIIKPSHYDDDGYVIQWVRAFVPSSSLAAVSAIAHDAARQQALGPEVGIEVREYDEVHTIIPVREIIRRILGGGGRGLILLTGVQSNQFPRAADLAREFRAAGIPVAVGGFHVSGCISMLDEIPPDIVAVQKTGVALFAGEAEGRLADLFRDAWRGELKPVYNYLDDLPALEGVVTPFLPVSIARRSFDFTAFDVGRGCPFRCSFCTIINVQGRKSRHRNADDVERIVRAYAGHGVRKMFITDDNMSRNKNWEQIFDRLIHLRQKEGLKFKLFIQVDTQCHKIPRFIEKAAQAGCRSVFIGMETVNPENLAAAKKFQNRISEYRVMLQAWRAHHVLTHAGYILGFPADTPESIERDIRTIQQELPIDILEFFVLTPLPGSADHQALVRQGVALDPDMNFYDTEHVTVAHERMTADEWRGIYDRAWHMYYSPEHCETLIRRGAASGIGLEKVANAIMTYYGSYRFEHLHPLQCGLFRRKVRTTRRPTLPLENPLVFYPRRAWEILKTHVAAGWYFYNLHRKCRQIANDPRASLYTDLALTPPSAADLKPAEESSACQPAPVLLQLPVSSLPRTGSADAA